MPTAPDGLSLLYSFRRCPYAMRARMVLLASGQPVRIREVILRNKPAALLALSEKATVPVLHLSNDEVLAESLEIMHWAVVESGDPAGLKSSPSDDRIAARLIDDNDRQFKPWLDRYKYFDRYPQHGQDYYREGAGEFLGQLEQRLGSSQQLLGSQATLADYAIMPFVRQFAAVDRDWFEQSAYTGLRRWLARWLQQSVFLQAMEKYPAWQPGTEEPVLEFSPPL